MQKNDENTCCAPSCCAKPDALNGGATQAPPRDAAALREAVKTQYGRAVIEVMKGSKPSCCGSASTALDWTDPITRDLYDASQTGSIPEDALRASFGCGNPTALAELREGETVLDLGSGGGIDVLLSAKRVGPTGKAYGLDMTEEMLELALRNKARAGATNVEFLKGHIEEIPLPAKSVDVIISNCVINLSVDKDRALREAFRVLKPGGRFAVSDIVVRRALPPEVTGLIQMWTGCIAGALSESDYVQKLEAAGFTDVRVEPTRIYTRADAAEMAGVLNADDASTSGVLDVLDGAVMSAFIRATKREAQP